MPRQPSPIRSPRCSASATATASSSSRCPRPGPIDTLLLGCTHYPLLRPIIASVVGDRVAIVDSASATASSLAELLSVNGLEAPGTTRGTAADPGALGHERPTETAAPATHVQLTTGDPETFRALANRLFGTAFPEVEQVELAVATT